MAGTITVEMGEVWVSHSPDERLVAVGLGACIGVCLYDPQARVAAMAHVVLPHTPSAPSVFRGQVVPSLPGKCADTAVAALIARSVERGAAAHNLRAVLAGGAQIFSHSTTAAEPSGGGIVTLSRLEIGPRNTVAVRDALAAAGIAVQAEDVGGSCGRTLTLCVGTGEVFVRRIGAEEQTLACLGLPQTPTAQERALAYER